jgi:hypothetical protein
LKEVDGEKWMFLALIPDMIARWPGLILSMRVGNSIASDSETVNAFRWSIQIFLRSLKAHCILAGRNMNIHNKLQ